MVFIRRNVCTKTSAGTISAGTGSQPRTTACREYITSQRLHDLIRAPLPTSSPHTWRSWLSQIQKALVCQRLLDLSTAWQATRQAIRDNANRKRSKATQKQHAVSTPRHGETMVLPLQVGAPNPERLRTGTTATSTALGVNRGAVEKAAYIRTHAPDLATQVEQGTVYCPVVHPWLTGYCICQPTL